MNMLDAETRAARVFSSNKGTGTGDALKLRGIQKYFKRRDGTRVPAVDGIDLCVAQGEFVVLLGPSGCGKTTLLRCIAGLESPDQGVITIHGEEHYSSADNVDSSPDRRKLGMVFQSYALWPHMKVFTNVAYPLQVKKVPRAEIRERVMNVMRTVGVEDLAEQFPGQLSGGQQQRVALARALVSSDGLLLFDEPLSNVDAKVREQLRFEIRRMQQQIGFAAIYVTHDQDEAMELADRIAVLNKGRVAQLDSPQNIYDKPADRYVAKFIGAANEVMGRIVTLGPGGSATVSTDAGPITGVLGQDDLAVGEEVSVIARPEKCRLLSATTSTGINEWAFEQATSLFVGANRRVVGRAVGWGNAQVQFSSREEQPVLGTSMRLHVPVEFARIYRK
ncbi:ABC transporter ATP-binding protein [Microvirga antarctica]|uniref:ABC transporter ATP-binding protein n=1 Tax=Microvirga antarctica TaxID=2819233 RepID=UPI001B31208F|nr:ABC transporter ATP-binding protein [Microvirga antarctica]